MESIDALEAALGICLHGSDDDDDLEEEEEDEDEELTVPDYDRVCNFFVWFRTYFGQSHCISIWGKAFGVNMYKFLCKTDIDNRAELVWDHFRDKPSTLRKIVNMYRSYVLEEKREEYSCTLGEVTEYSKMFLYYSTNFNNSVCGEIWPRLKSPYGGWHHMWEKYLELIESDDRGKRQRMLRMPCVAVLYGALDNGNRKLIVDYWKRGQEASAAAEK